MTDRRTNAGGDHQPDDPLALARARTRSLTEAVFAVDREGRIAFANPAFETLFGWTEEELRGQDVECYIALRAVAAQVLTERRAVRADRLSLRRRDGSGFVAACSGAPVQCGDEVTGACVTVSDVTEPCRVAAPVPEERRQLEGVAEGERLHVLAPERRARKENEEAHGRLASILGSISDALVCIDAEWRYTFVNDWYARMVGATSASTSGGGSLWDEFPRARNTDFHLELAHAMRDQMPVAFEAWSEDLARWLDVRAYPLQDGLAVSLQDISGRKALEDARDALYLQLEGERGRLEAVVQQMPAAVVIFDADGHSQVENRRVTEILGPAPPLSRHLQDGSLRRIPDGRPLEREDSPLTRALGGEKVMGLEVMCTRGDGRDKVLRLSATPLRDARGQISGAVLVFYDITEQKRAEEAERFLARAIVELGASLDYLRTLESLAWMAVPRLADWCTVDLVDEETGRVRCVAAAHVDAGRLSMLRSLKEDAADPDADFGVARVLRTGRTELSSFFDPEMAAENGDIGPLARLRQVGLCSLLLVPLNVQARCVGVLTFAMGESGRTYDEHDRRLAEELVHRAAFAYENARLHRETEQRASRARILADVSRDLSASLRSEDLLCGVLRSLVSQTGNWCVVDVLDERGEMAGCTYAHTDPAKEPNIPLARSLLMRSPFFPPRESLRQMRLIYAPDASTELRERAQLAAADVDALQALGLGSFVVCPLVVRGTALGTLSVASEKRGAFTRDDREFIEDLANRIALSLDNARLYRAEQMARLALDGQYARERDLVKTLGTSLLGDLPAGYPSLDLAAVHRFALEAHRVGGDYYDFIPLDEHRLGVVVGDVCGKGIEASVITAAAKYLLRAYAYEDASPATVLGRLNQALCREIRSGAVFVTLVYAVIDVRARAVIWGNAGHPPPVLYDAREERCRRLEATGGFVGASADFTYGETALPFEGTSVLALFTDGVSEACGALDPLGDGGVSDILLRSRGGSSARAVADLILGQTIACAGPNPRDDLAIAVVAGRA